MKFLLLLTFISLSAASAKECQVYGISDGPQKLDCRIGKDSFLLRCRNGQYFLNSKKIIQAYHMEVERGPVPLVFETPGSRLTVLFQSEADISAEFESGGRLYLGTCSKRSFRLK